jgi:hypothetical protein
MNSAALFSLLRLEIPGYAGTVFGNIDGTSLYTDGYPGEEGAAVGRALAGLARGHHALYQELGGAMDFGSNDEVLVTASRGFLLLRLHHERKRFIGVQLHASGNIGYLRFRMREYLRMVLEGA